MTQLGKAIGILLQAHMNESDMHSDVDAFHAPSECHDLVSRGEGRRLRFARRHALHVAGFKNIRQLRHAARQIMGNDAPIYRRYGMVPY